MAKVIVVFGATGNQGGGVVAGLVKNKNYEVRGVTRNAQRNKAKALETQGVKVVEGNLNEPKSLSGVLSECYGSFLVTEAAGNESQQGKNWVDACKGAGVKHLVFSGSDDISKTTGKPCFFSDYKVVIEKYMFASGVPCTAVRYPCFYENFLDFNMVMAKKDDHGTIVIGYPQDGKPIDFISVVGAGNVVAAIFDAPRTYIGKTVGISGGRKTIQECADILSKVLAPKTFKASEVTTDQFAKSGDLDAIHLASMYEFIQRDDLDYNFELTQKLDPSTQSFEDWVKANKDALNAVYQ